MLDPIKVKAASGIKYPLEGTPSKHIAGGDTVEVPDTAYYRKAISDGDLALVTAPPEAAAPAPATAASATAPTKAK
jgi:hypothetical protein